MKHYYRLMVPSTIYDAKAPDEMIDAVRRAVKVALAREFGGYTETETMGGYLAESGELIEETIYQIEACYDTPNDDLIWKLSERIKTEMSQESVMIRKDHEVHFV